MTAIHRSAALLGVAVILCAGISGCSGKVESFETIVPPSVSEDDNDWYAPTETTFTMENETVRFEMDTETTHFTVTVLKTGRQYHSVPPESAETILDEASFRMSSELTICYYADTSTALYMYSGRDSVENTIISDGESVRIYYQMGAANQVVPKVLDQKTFDGIMDSLANDAIRRRMERYYVLYSNNQPDDYAEQLEKYPVLSKQPLYILQDELMSQSDKDDLSGYLESAGYTVDDYKAMLASLNIDNVEIEQPAGFVIPVEYRLAEDGFTAEVLTDRIEESSPDYKLQSVELLEYFASVDKRKEGTFVIPDGSGALIDFNHPDDMLYSQPYYGGDCALEQKEMAPICKTLNLPVFGMSMQDSGVLAIIENAAEVATLHVSPSSDVSPQNHIYASFAMRSIDVTENDTDWFMPRFNLLSEKRLTISPRIRYILLDEDNSSYAKMAARYRNELLSNGMLNQEKVQMSPLYLDYICMFTEEASLLGIPYTKKIVLSTLPEIMESVRKFYEAGVGPIILRLVGYSSSGLENSAYNTFQLDPKVGTVAQLQELASLLASKGGQLYLDADIQFAYNTGNGFSLADDAAHYLNRMVVRIKRQNIVTRDFLENAETSDSFGTRYFISPARYADYAANFRDGLKKAWNQANALPGLSYSSSGLYLGGDYGSRKNISPAMSVELLKQALKQSKESEYKMMFDNGNAYVLPYATHLLNVPLQSSEWDIEATKIPFYQMVVHGSISYAGTPDNVARNSEEAFLQSVASGASPYFAFITRSDALLANTGYAGMWYSLSVAARIPDVTAQIKTALEAAEMVQGEEMTGMQWLSETLSCTSYGNGRKIYVNYGEKDVMIDGMDIPARGVQVE